MPARSSARITAGRIRARASSSPATACSTASTSRSWDCGRCTRKCARVSIYVSLASRPPAFDGLRARFEAAGAPQGFDRARIAHVADYEVEANWKLVWENNRECYHCTPRHPQYVKSNFDVYDEAQASEAVRQKIAAAIARIETKWAVPGDGVAHPTGGLATFPDPDNGIWYTCNRTALAEGFATESMDGSAGRATDGRLPLLPTSACCGCAACRTSGSMRAAITQ